MTTIKNEVRAIFIEKNRIDRLVSNKLPLDNDDLKSRLVAEINYFNTYLSMKVDEFEKINNTILTRIEDLNRENKKKQRLYKKLNDTYQANKNMGSGMEVAFEDSSLMLMNILRNILLKNVALIGLYYYIFI
jgi:hypothetical protein